MRWLILTSSTGTGHNMRAAALRQWVERVYGDTREVRVLHALEETHGLYRAGVETYNAIQRFYPALHHLYFRYLEVAGMHRHGGRILGRENFVKQVRAFAPHRVVSVHAHTNHGFFQLCREALPERPPKCFVYCGELDDGWGLSRHWLSREADGFVGATEEVCAAARGAGLAAERVHCGGFLLRPSFYRPEREIEREAGAEAVRLGLDRQKFILLMTTGLAGANNHRVVLEALRREGAQMQVIALCGENLKLRRELETGARKWPGLTVRVQGTTEHMAALFRLASLVFARPGTGATSEAIHCGTPLLHNGIGGVMPQETLTRSYCEKHGCAVPARTPAEVAREVWRLARNPEALSALRGRMERARPPGHPEEICRWIAEDRA